MMKHFVVHQSQHFSTVLLSSIMCIIIIIIIIFTVFQYLFNNFPNGIWPTFFSELKYKYQQLEKNQTLYFEKCCSGSWIPKFAPLNFKADCISEFLEKKKISGPQTKKLALNKKDWKSFINEE